MLYIPDFHINYLTSATGQHWCAWGWKQEELQSGILHSLHDSGRMLPVTVNLYINGSWCQKEEKE